MSKRIKKTFTIIWRPPDVINRITTHKLHVTSLVHILSKLTPLNCHFALKISIEDSCWRFPEGAGERVYEAEARAPSWGCEGGREGLSSSHRSTLSCFWTPVIPFLAFLLKQFSLSASPCHRKSPRRRVRSELMGVSFCRALVCNCLLKWRL